MKTYTISESKAQLSSLVKEVMRTGKPIVIGQHGQPMVQLTPYKPVPKGKRLGAFEGQITLAEDFDTWDAEEAEAFGIDG